MAQPEAFRLSGRASAVACAYPGPPHHRPVEASPTDTSAREEIDGFPCEFDRWALHLLGQAILQSPAAEDRQSYWQPVLGLPAAAHHWVETFLSGWFTAGVEFAEPPGAFVRAWSEMVSFALADPAWDPQGASRFNLSGRVCELLGLNWGFRTVAEDARFGGPLGSVAELFTRAAGRWFSLVRVVSAYARFIAKPAAERLLRAGIGQLHDAAELFDESDWNECGLKANLIGALQACWERHPEEVAGDDQLRLAFLGLLTKLASRGSHAASALRDRVLKSG